MAMKIFREEKPVEAVTPDQLAMKIIFKEQKASVPVAPGNAAMKIFREEKIHQAKSSFFYHIFAHCAKVLF